MQQQNISVFSWAAHLSPEEGGGDGPNLTARCESLR